VRVDDEEVDGVGTDVEHAQPHAAKLPERARPGDVPRETRVTCGDDRDPECLAGRAEPP
jgi:hypothetical protein